MTFRQAAHIRDNRAPSRKEVWRMFDRVAHRYDFLNRLLSFGIDSSWRRKVAFYLPDTEPQHALDLATGTADQLIALLDESKKVKSGIGMDLAEKMLKIGRKKIELRGLSGNISLEIGSATEVPAGDNEFDVVTISFGIRNVTSVPKALSEMHRVLKPGGRLLVLEFSLPENRLVRGVHLFYLRHVLPHLGAIVSGDPYAYRYLNETIETFPHGEALCNLMREAGFVAVSAHPITFGVASIYQADRPLGRE